MKKISFFRRSSHLWKDWWNIRKERFFILIYKKYQSIREFAADLPATHSVFDLVTVKNRTYGMKVISTVKKRGCPFELSWKGICKSQGITCLYQHKYRIIDTGNSFVLCMRMGNRGMFQVMWKQTGTGCIPDKFLKGNPEILAADVTSTLYLSRRNGEIQFFWNWIPPDLWHDPAREVSVSMRKGK